MPHEETSGGDYAIARSAAIVAENASSLVIRRNDLEHLGGNGIFLSNSVKNVTIADNYFRYYTITTVHSLYTRYTLAIHSLCAHPTLAIHSPCTHCTLTVHSLYSYLGTSGVLLVGRTGGAMMDARDGEAMLAAGGVDNGVRLPKNNLVTRNVFANYGIFDKQSAAFHKALAPGEWAINRGSTVDAVVVQ
jgi:hypothetical protein